MAGKKVSLSLGLDAFCNDLQAKAVGERYGRKADGGIVLVNFDVLDEGAVEFE